MKHDKVVTGKRKPINLSLDTGIVQAARDVGLNLSQISEAALREATRQEQARRWRENNRAAIDGWKRWYEANGDPLEHLRLW